MVAEDWDSYVAFVRLDFPPAQRDTAQEIASLLAHFVGPAIKRLNPEQTLGEILGWAERDPVDPVEFVMALEEEFDQGVDQRFATDPNAYTFRALVSHASGHGE